MNISNKSEQKSSCKTFLLCGLLYRIDDKDGGCGDHADNDGGNSEDEIDADERWKKWVVIAIDAAGAGVDGNDNVVVMILITIMVMRLMTLVMVVVVRC